MEDHYISPVKFSALFNVKPEIIIGWIREGLIKDVLRTPSGRFKIPVSEIDGLKDRLKFTPGTSE